MYKVYISSAKMIWNSLQSRRIYNLRTVNYLHRISRPTSKNSRDFGKIWNAGEERRKKSLRNRDRGVEGVVRDMNSKKEKKRRNSRRRRSRSRGLIVINRDFVLSISNHTVTRSFRTGFTSITRITSILALLQSTCCWSSQRLSQMWTCWSTFLPCSSMME